MTPVLWPLAWQEEAVEPQRPPRYVTGAIGALSGKALNWQARIGHAINNEDYVGRNKTGYEFGPIIEMPQYEEFGATNESKSSKDLNVKLANVFGF